MPQIRHCRIVDGQSWNIEVGIKNVSNGTVNSSLIPYACPLNMVVIRNTVKYLLIAILKRRHYTFASTPVII
jgi:hypothetical protein